MSNPLAKSRPPYATTWEEAKGEFLRLRGTRQFWTLTDEQRSGAVGALFYAMLYADEDHASHEFHTIMDEYRRREAFVLIHPLPPTPLAPGAPETAP